NELGLYDMSSNISEWCWDKYGPYTKGFWSNPTGSENGLLRVIRGGSTVSNRDKNSPLYCVCYLGFRLVKSSTKVLNTGVIIFDINPENAKIVLSKDSMTIYESTGSQRISCLPVGEYELSVSMPGYKSLINRFVIKKSERLLKSVCLEKGPSIVNKFAFVEGGDFQMRRNKRRSFEEPVYTVTLNSFYISVFQITQKEWGEVMGSNPSNNKGDNLPVENITWFDVIIYCNKRSFQEGLTQCYSNDTSKNIFCNFDANGYRLPTEAEWVYAARGGKHSKGYKYSGSDDIEEVAWYNENSGDKTHPVGQKMPNELGLYDMSGNVLEWCWDWRDLCSIVFYNKPKCVMLGNDCVIRGGDYSKSSVECGLWYQNSCNFMHKHSGLGARLVRSRI
ncbi:MAG: SUMF1/EgtB/PvdO family nonheme iron enzyme, partial [Candidatus Cloacimonas sp.]